MKTASEPNDRDCLRGTKHPRETAVLIAAFGARLRLLRKQAGFTQEDLASRSGLHRTYIADMERGARNPSLGTIGKLAKALDVQIADFFPGESKAEVAG